MNQVPPDKRRTGKKFVLSRHERKPCPPRLEDAFPIERQLILNICKVLIYTPAREESEHIKHIKPSVNSKKHTKRKFSYNFNLCFIFSSFIEI